MWLLTCDGQCINQFWCFSFSNIAGQELDIGGQGGRDRLREKQKFHGGKKMIEA